jgi:hypothetical protein
MKKLFILLLIILLNPIPSLAAEQFKLKVNQSYSLPCDLQTTVTQWDGQNINFKIFEVEDDKSPYPIGTEFIGKVISTKEAKRLSRSESKMIQISSVKLPDGSFEPEDIKIKLLPSQFLTEDKAGAIAIGAPALTLTLVIDGLLVGLPVSRGGLAIWFSTMAVRNAAPGTSKLKAGTIGFAKGAIYPIPLLVAKGKTLDGLAVGSKVSIDEESRGKSLDAFLIN